MLWKLQALCQKQKKKKKEIEQETEKKKQTKYRNVTFKQPLRGTGGAEGWGGNKGRRFYNIWSHSTCKVYPVNYDIH